MCWKSLVLAVIVGRHMLLVMMIRSPPCCRQSADDTITINSICSSTVNIEWYTPHATNKTPVKLMTLNTSRPPHIHARVSDSVPMKYYGPKTSENFILIMRFSKASFPGFWTSQAAFGRLYQISLSITKRGILT